MKQSSINIPRFLIQISWKFKMYSSKRLTSISLLFKTEIFQFSYFISLPISQILMPYIMKSVKLFT